MVKSFKNYTKDELLSSGMEIGDNVFISNDVIIHNPIRIKIGNNVRIDTQCLLIAGENNKIIIGSNIHISAGCYFYGNSGDIILEDYVTISGRCTLYTANDDYIDGYLTNPCVNVEFRKVNIGNVIIKEYTIIGCNSTILPNVTLNKGTSCGAYSFIKKSTQEYDLVTGIPTKFIKKRNKIYIK